MIDASITIDGTVYRLAFDFNAIADAEISAGCNLLAGLEDLAHLNARQLRGLFYAAITGDRPSIEATGALIRLETIAPITLALAHAYNLTLKEQEKEEEPEAALAEAGV